MDAQSKVIGTVALVEGQAFARGTDGVQRQLKVGDPVLEGEIIVTSEGGRVELTFDSGHTFLLREKETVNLDTLVTGNELPDAKDAALLGRVGEAVDIARAIANGSSLDQLLEETAAGFTGGTGEDGHSFVQLLRIGEGLTPADYTFGSPDRNQLNDVLPGDGNDTSGIGSGVQSLGTTSAPTGSATVSLAASGSVAEGGNIIYTATLTSPAQGAITVLLSNGARITIASGATTGSVAVAAPSDDVYLDASTVSASIASATGGNFASLAINPASTSTSITDTVDSTTVALPVLQV